MPKDAGAAGVADAVLVVEAAADVEDAGDAAEEGDAALVTVAGASGAEVTEFAAGLSCAELEEAEPQAAALIARPTAITVTA